MRAPIAISFGNQLTDLATFIRANTESLTPESGFARHVYDAAGETGPLADVVPSLQVESLAAGHGPSLAAAGYTLANQLPKPAPHLMRAWSAGLSRLSAKDAFPADHQTFAFRPFEVLGIAIGATLVDAIDPDAVAWLRRVIERLGGEGSGDFWSQLITSAAASMMGVARKGIVPPRVGQMETEEIALCRWIPIAIPAISGDLESPFDNRQLDAELLRRAVTSTLAPRDVARAALLHYALRRAVDEHIESHVERTWQTGRDTLDAVQIVVQLCRRFPLFAKQLLVRHDHRSTIEMTDEYDVQDAMHALLRLHFDDVRPEEVAPSYAGSSSRMDFLLKREKVVVEVKMTRKGLGQKAVANQLIEDKERYRTHPDYKTLICFVYDPQGFCDNPVALESDVSQGSADFQVVVVVSPRGT